MLVLGSVPQTMHYAWEILQNDHQFALFDPPQKGNLTTPVYTQQTTRGPLFFIVHLFPQWASIAGTPRSGCPRRAASIFGEARWEGGCAWYKVGPYKWPKVTG